MQEKLQIALQGQKLKRSRKKTSEKSSDEGKTLLVKGYCGIGDHVHMRPFILDASKRYGKIYIESAFPDIFFHDIPNVVCLPKPHVTKGVIDRVESCKKAGLYGEKMMQYDELIKFSYGDEIKRSKAPILKSFQSQLPHSQYPNIDLSFPVKDEWKEAARKIVPQKKICFLRLATNRAEWGNFSCSRNPKMEYVEYAVKRAKEQGYFIVSVNNLKEYNESIDGAIPAGIDLFLHEGQLSTTAMIGLMSIADIAIVTPSNAMLLGASLGTKTLAIFGGFSSSEIYFDPLKLPHVTCIDSDQKCCCFDVRHGCSKHINTERLVKSCDEFFNVKSVVEIKQEGLYDEKGRPYRMVMRHGVERRLYI